MSRHFQGSPISSTAMANTTNGQQSPSTAFIGAAKRQHQKPANGRPQQSAVANSGTTATGGVKRVRHHHRHRSRTIRQTFRRRYSGTANINGDDNASDNFDLVAAIRANTNGDDIFMDAVGVLPTCATSPLWNRSTEFRPPSEEMDAPSPQVEDIPRSPTIRFQRHTCSVI